MKVTVHGQTVQTFLITVADDNGKNETVYDIQQELVVDDSTVANLGQEQRDAAAKEHFWNQIAITAEMELADFEQTFYASFQAHVERFVGYYLKARGDKSPTVGMKDKHVTLLFSEQIDPDEQATRAGVAYQGYITECKAVGITPVDLKNFTEIMYGSYDAVETVERMRLGLVHRTKQLKAVSSAFNTKSWSIKTLAADRRKLVESHIG